MESHVEGPDQAALSTGVSAGAGVAENLWVCYEMIVETTPIILYIVLICPIYIVSDIDLYGSNTQIPGTKLKLPA